MIYMGMDVHQKSTVFCLFDPGKPRPQAFRWLTRPTVAKSFEDVLRPLKGQCEVAYEVGTQAQWVARIVRPLAAKVHVANPSRVPWLFRDGRKNDRLDAKKLATLVALDQLPTVHLPAPEVSAWRALINHRRALVKRGTIVKNQIRTILRTFARPCPHRSCWTRAGQSWLASQLFDSARDLMMRSLREELTGIGRRLRDLEAELDAIAATQPNVALLRTIPGVGPRTAEAIVAYGDDVKRFAHRKEFASYFGMTPTLDASGGVCRHGHISKRGPSVVRWVLVEAVHQMVGRCPAFRDFFWRIYGGKKNRYKKAIVATGRKALTIMFAMLRDQAVFDAAKVSRSAV